MELMNTSRCWVCVQSSCSKAHRTERKRPRRASVPRHEWTRASRGPSVATGACWAVLAQMCTPAHQDGIFLCPSKLSYTFLLPSNHFPTNILKNKFFCKLFVSLRWVGLMKGCWIWECPPGSWVCCSPVILNSWKPFHQKRAQFSADTHRKAKLGRQGAALMSQGRVKHRHHLWIMVHTLAGQPGDSEVSSLCLSLLSGMKVSSSRACARVDGPGRRSAVNGEAVLRESGGLLVPWRRGQLWHCERGWRQRLEITLLCRGAELAPADGARRRRRASVLHEGQPAEVSLR